MIITLKGADFSKSNIGTLSTWRITHSLGAGAAYEGVTSVNKGAAFSATVTLDEDYEVGTAGVTVTMGGAVLSDAHSISGNVITITIAEVTGNVLIKVPTININTGEEDEPDTPINYTFTINPTPSNAIVTLTASGYSQSGNSIAVPNGTTVSWSVSASGYTEQTGTWTANGSNETLPVTLSAVLPAGNVMDYVVNGKSITGLGTPGNNAEFFAVIDYPVIAGHKYSIPYARNGYFSNESEVVSTKIFQGGGKATYSITALEGATKMSVCFKHVDIAPENASITDLGNA